MTLEELKKICDQAGKHSQDCEMADIAINYMPILIEIAENARNIGCPGCADFEVNTIEKALKKIEEKDPPTEAD